MLDIKLSDGTLCKRVTIPPCTNFSTCLSNVSASIGNICQSSNPGNGCCVMRFTFGHSSNCTLFLVDNVGNNYGSFAGNNTVYTLYATICNSAYFSVVDCNGNQVGTINGLPSFGIPGCGYYGQCQ
ncbi:MAG: hypothetical protein IPO92_24375 [Saprospiraceae bacterium]|nr:hypothetical protein [Saprospiraceae bacterium]